MLRFPYLPLLALCLAAFTSAPAQQRSAILIQPLLEERILISTDRPVYYPEDTLRLSIEREDTTSESTVSPIVEIDGLVLELSGRNTYMGVIPQTVTPGSYRVLLKIVNAEGQRFYYETGHVVEVEEYQVVERLANYVSIVPFDGRTEPETAPTLEADQLRSLYVVFHRDSIQMQKGPQFITMKVTVQLRDGTTMQTFERRVLTFRPHGNPERDRAMFIQYRTAYGAYAAISTNELDRVRVPLDSLPSWALVKVVLEPDYTIRIGEYERTNSVIRYYRVKGPTIEVDLSLGIPKVLYDSQASDTIDYGNTSAMLRFYHISGRTGNRFPVSFAIGTFGGASPIDVGVGRGGFAASTLLDLVELTSVREIKFLRRVIAGLELTYFVPIERKSRLLVNAQVGLSL